MIKTKGGHTMKKALYISVVALLTLGLVGCAATSPNSTQKVKCPACGYQFDTPAARP